MTLTPETHSNAATPIPSQPSLSSGTTGDLLRHEARSITEKSSFKETPSPREFIDMLPLTVDQELHIGETRRTLKNILRSHSMVPEKQKDFSHDARLIVIVGECGIHDVEATREFASRVAELRAEISSTIVPVIRIYPEKPRTDVGWKGFCSDPHQDKSDDMEFGIFETRRLMSEVNSLGLGVATEFLDPQILACLSDQLSWACVGARTAASQTHRILASTLPCPVGFKNYVDGDIEVAVKAMMASRASHTTYGPAANGKWGRQSYSGNDASHLILRGGSRGTNYEREHIRQAVSELQKNEMDIGLIVDCSHANSGKKFVNQPRAFLNVVEQFCSGDGGIAGVMLESSLKEGKQPSYLPKAAREYGVSVTDECMGWDMTAGLLRRADELIRNGRRPIH